ncbi:MAG: cardiolipin synthase [Alphaproteobacteria bacterium]|nr:cardiolipin synthase [Alphaproteobacteria bacterium]
MTYYLFILAVFIVDFIVIIWVLLRPHREPASRIAWVAVIILLPILGAGGYWLLGEVNIGRKRIIRLQKIQDAMPSFSQSLKALPSSSQTAPTSRFEHLFKLGKSISKFDPVSGNHAQLLASSAAMIDSLVIDIDAATAHVHMLFYIWLPDESGQKVAEALMRASKRGVKCRAMVDSIGSAELLRSDLWQTMQDAGVQMAEILPIGNPISKIIKSRIDLRNHRKIVIIDGNITYCGSQNCMNDTFDEDDDMQWVDMVLRITGPIARQNQYLFANDWMICTGQDISYLLHEPLAEIGEGFTAQVIGTGPTDRHLAMSQMFVELIATARQELIITTPYYIPNEAIQSAIQSAAYRGVKTIMIFPAKNDSWLLQAASHSYYQELLDAGVKIYEYTSGLLHTKSLSIDGEFAMIGSANLDRRSFDLNYENNMLIYDQAIVGQIIERQKTYILQSNAISQITVASWPTSRKLVNNIIAMLGPIL